MKKAVPIIVCIIISALICGCGAKEQNHMATEGCKTATFINEANDADIWILPKTEKNLKTTVWGTATAAAVKKGESRSFELCEPGDGGMYIFRMIDTDGLFYSANDIVLQAGHTMRIKENDIMSFTLEVADEKGALQSTYEVFAAKL